MNAIEAIGAMAVPALGGEPVIARLGGVAAAGGAPGSSFSDILSAGIQQVDGKLSTADSLVRQFALDDSVPVHQVTYALEEARLSVELAMQVRARLVEGYRDLMNMQL